MIDWRARLVTSFVEALREQGRVDISALVASELRKARSSAPDLAVRIEADKSRLLQQIELAIDSCSGGRVDRKTDNVVIVALERGDLGLDRYLEGHWFEEWIWAKVGAALKDTPAEVHLAVAVSARADLERQEQAQAYDLDVAIFANDQLHAIECKAGRGKQGKQQQGERDHVAVIKSTLIGPYGRMWLARVQSLATDAAGYEQAAMTEIGLMAGKASIEEMLARVRRLVR